MKRLMAIAAVVAAMTAQAEMAADVESDLASEPPKKSEAVKDIVVASGTDATIRPGDTKDAVAAALAKLGPGSVLTIAAGEDLGGDCPQWILAGTVPGGLCTSHIAISDVGGVCGGDGG